MHEIRKALLSSCFTLSVLASTVVSSQEVRPGIKVIDPDKKVPSANAAALDTEHFEFGLYAGILAVEDFNTNPVAGGTIRYYVNEKFFAEGALGSSRTEASGPEEFLDATFNSDRNFTYFSASAGYQFLKGRSFRGKKRKFNTGLYVIGGLAQVDFAGESNTGLVIGVSHKTLLTDWLVINFDFKDYIVQRNFQNDDKLTQNVELAIGANLLF